MAKLSSQGRKQVKRENFAVPKGTGSNPDSDDYPIHDKSHAQNALSQVEKNGTPSEKSQVRRAVGSKYPSIDQDKARGGRKRRT